MLRSSCELDWRVHEKLNVPFWNGLPLCSLRNPQREAEKWRSLQSACEHVLVIGVGAAVHLPLCPSEKILFFDPSEQIVAEVGRRYPQFTGSLTSSQDQVIEFLAHLPAIWIFRPAFNGRSSDLAFLLDLIREKEVQVGAFYLQKESFQGISDRWNQFDHHNYKFGVHNFGALDKTSLTDQEICRIQILQELVK